MDFGSRVLKDVAKAFENMTKEEYLKLYESAKKLDSNGFHDHLEIFFDDD